MTYDRATETGGRVQAEKRFGEQLTVSRGIAREAFESLAAIGLLGLRKATAVFCPDGSSARSAGALHVQSALDLSSQ